MVSNPFVVLSDVTIALAIIFLVFAIATAVTNTQILMFFDRNERQQKMENELVAALRSVLPNAVASHVRMAGEKRDHVELREDGVLVGVVWTNASFQRVQILKPTFVSGRSEPTDLCKQFLRAVGGVVELHAEDVSYLFFHGVTETAEAKTLDSARVQSLSEDRARAAFDYLAKSASAPVLGIPRRFVIPYGTGDALYRAQGAQVGRVDFLMFYSDTRNGDWGRRG